MLYAKRVGPSERRRYTDLVFERFWKRELDIEDASIIESVLAEAGVDTGQFSSYAAGEGRSLQESIVRDAEAEGIFGVPTFVIDEELFWGKEHLSLIRERLLSA